MVEYRVKLVEYRVKLVEYRVNLVEYRVKTVEYQVKLVTNRISTITAPTLFSSSEQSPGRVIVLPPALALVAVLAKC